MAIVLPRPHGRMWPDPAELIAPALAVGARLVAGPEVRWLAPAGYPGPEDRQRVYFANHASHLDAVVIWAVLPPELRRRTRPVAARDYWARDPLRAYLSTRVLRAVLIERERVTPRTDPIGSILREIGRTDSLIVFPEGTRSADGEPVPFRSGLYHLARRRPDLELIPVQLHNLDRVLPKGECLPVPLTSTVTFGPPLRLEPAEDRPAFLARAQAAVWSLKPC